MRNKMKRLNMHDEVNQYMWVSRMTYNKGQACTQTNKEHNQLHCVPKHVLS